MELAFLVPGALDQLTGGYLYDRHVVHGLRARGHRVDVVELEGRHPDADESAGRPPPQRWPACRTGPSPQSTAWPCLPSPRAWLGNLRACAWSASSITPFRSKPA